MASLKFFGVLDEILNFFSFNYFDIFLVSFIAKDSFIIKVL